MRKALLFLLSATFGLVAGGLTLPAMAGSIFMVDKINVDMSGPSASVAREMALSNGQKQALDIVLRRLTLRDEWPLLPNLEDVAVDDLVEGFRVSNEKTGNKRYLATLSVQFKPTAIRALLRARGTSVTEVQSRPVLLVPVLENQDGLQAWGEHWWRESWNQRDLDNVPAPMTLPLGDIDDSTLLSAEDALIGHPLKLDALNQRYDTETVVVAHALADVTGRLGVSVYIFAPNESDVIIRTYSGAQSLQEMADTAIDDVMDELNHRWKQVAAVTSDEMGTRQLRLEFTDLKSWQRQLGKLDAADLIRQLKIVEMTAAYAYVDIAHIGTQAQLMGNLQQVGLRLEPLADSWRVIEAQAY
jgi:hypothetical protein